MTIKTRYFSPEMIQKEARQLLNQLPGQKEGLLAQFIPDQSALLILDMQSYFLDPNSHAFIPSAEAIVPGLQALAQAYYAHDLPVIFTQHLNTDQDAGSMAIWWRDLIRIEDPLSTIIPAFDFSNRYVLRKSQYDAFYNSKLEESLRKKRVSQVVISGVMTHLCCETTARSAFVRGFEVFFLVDGTATYNQDHHLASLRNLSHGFAAPVFTSEILEVVERETGKQNQ
jgi:isochorismate hydrolase